eukprot:gb/GECG01009172.1/.p1 GENE.gb/GECG01009172.1/~~gb/GECG01009172.1/.p1  ORF type:complete len:137 (+),score=12.50 gb/GECG01009172.1/:1-411(+)
MSNKNLHEQRSAASSTSSLGPNQGRQVCKLHMLGHTATGKTSLLKKYSGDNDPLSTIANIGIDFRVLNMEVNGKPIKCQIYDTAGQERFASLGARYLRGTDGILLVYDITYRDSFMRAKSVLTETIPVWKSRYIGY